MIPRHLQIAVTVLLAAALGLSIYAWHVRKTVAATPAAPVDTRPLAPPVTGPTEKVVLYVAQDDDGTLRAQPAQIPMPSGRQQRAEELARALISLYLEKNSPHVIGAGTEVRSVFLVDPGVAVIDMNGAFADSHRSGVLVEELTVASLIHTITANTPNILRVKILIDGKQRETLAGHADLSSFYEVAAVDQLASQLQAGQ
ncbi:MAG: GerMN domain-containing protein [Candidatus Sulfotelmatobacter sp.]|jgi:spore germination protein GerM|nr:GerMN domain-containing protein [Terriglobales bacterium]